MIFAWAADLALAAVGVALLVYGLRRYRPVGPGPKIPTVPPPPRQRKVVDRSIVIDGWTVPSASLARMAAEAIEAQPPDEEPAP